MGEMDKARFSAGPLTFAVRHERDDGQEVHGGNRAPGL